MFFNQFVQLKLKLFYFVRIIRNYTVISKSLKYTVEMVWLLQLCVRCVVYVTHPEVEGVLPNCWI